jgi:hypothetical protein
MLAGGLWRGDDLLRQFPVACDQQLETLSKGDLGLRIPSNEQLGEPKRRRGTTMRRYGGPPAAVPVVNSIVLAVD